MILKRKEENKDFAREFSEAPGLVGRAVSLTVSGESANIFLKFWKGVMGLMNTMETERMIDLKNLFFRVLKRWRLLLVLLVLGLLLGAAFKFVQGRIGAKSSPEAEKAYEDQVKEYEIQKANCEWAVKDARDSLEAYQDYLDHSVLSKLDPYNIPTTEARLIISASAVDESSPNAPSVLTNGIRYILYNLDSALKSTDCFAKLSGLTGTEERFLRELITFTPATASNTLDITVYYSDLETAQKILDALLDYADDASKDLKLEGIASYKVAAIKSYSGMSVSSTVNTAKTNLSKNLTTLKTNLTTAETALKALVSPKASGRGASLRDMMKFALLFGAAFFLLGIVLVALKVLFPYKVLSSEDAEHSFRLPVFTTYGSISAKHNTRFDKWIRRHLEGKTSGLDTDAHSAILKVASEAALQDTDVLFLVGTEDDGAMDKILESLKKTLSGKEVKLTKGVLSDPSLLGTIPGGSSALLLEKLEKSTYAGIVSELNYLKGRDVSVKGLVLFE